MGTHVSTWYRADGPMSLDEIVRNYTVMVLRQLGMATDEIDRVQAETPA